MSKYIIIFILFFLGSGVLVSFSNENIGEINEFKNSSLERVMNVLGAPKLIHSMVTFDEQKALVGEDLIFLGKTKRKGRKSKRISKYFVCTDCHNTVKEFDDISSQSSKERLKYAIENGLPFLQGSTFWGIYNRTKFYNDDYVSKYGEMAVNARDSLRNAIQVCAKYCSSGRYLKDWELESIMHYYKKNELKIDDLSLTVEEKERLKESEKLNEFQKKELVSSIQKKYVQGYSATFLEAMPLENREFGEDGDVKNGEAIYDKSCLYCHAYKRVTYLSFDKGVLSGKMFWQNIKNYSDKSLYQIVRWGTHSKPGRKQYMPRYTKEKMSDNQLNDLVAYIKQLAKK